MVFFLCLALDTAIRMDRAIFRGGNVPLVLPQTAILIWRDGKNLKRSDIKILNEEKKGHSYF